MVSKQNWFRFVLLAVVVLAMLGIPIAAGAQAAVGITSPAAAATVSGTVDVKGTAGGPDFSKWQLDLLPGGDPNAAIFLALGNAPGAVAYTLDTTKWPDGAHALRLRSVRSNGNYDESVAKFTIANKAKVAAAATAAAPVAATTAVTATKAMTATVPAAATTAVTTTKATTATVPAVVAAPATPAPVAPMANGISSPKPGSTISGSVPVTGTAGGPTFSKWQLDLLPGADPNAAVFLAVGNVPAVSYVFDSKIWPDGKHALRLRNVRTDSNYDEYTNPITITNKSAAPAAAAPAAAAPAPAASAAVTSTAGAKDIVATAIASGKFTTLVKAVQAAGLVEALQGKGPFTVFAPTDAAFAALPAGTLDNLLKDPAALKNVLLYHVLPAEVMAAQVKDGLTAKTLQGSDLKFSVANGVVKVGDATVITTDIATSNGVIHVIDKVLLPPAQ
jgi:uncharacterized surface protein with fasciclin (FAS1) repeats